MEIGESSSVSLLGKETPKQNMWAWRLFRMRSVSDGNLTLKGGAKGSATGKAAAADSLGGASASAGDSASASPPTHSQRLSPLVSLASSPLIHNLQYDAASLRSVRRRSASLSLLMGRTSSSTSSSSSNLVDSSTQLQLAQQKLQDKLKFQQHQHKHKHTHTHTHTHAHHHHHMRKRASRSSMPSSASSKASFKSVASLSQAHESVIHEQTISASSSIEFLETRTSLENTQSLSAATSILSSFDIPSYLDLVAEFPNIGVPPSLALSMPSCVETIAAAAVPVLLDLSYRKLLQRNRPFSQLVLIARFMSVKLETGGGQQQQQQQHYEFEYERKPRLQSLQLRSLQLLQQKQRHRQQQHGKKFVGS
ncbi:hypothetical protein HK100_005111 [Physocladia obscura]|uniref:Uncharacterized protein n=1 Tax=Physocladia obscura TaxID=109957 RepID=A0AAD5SS38_9FUNG|nr:hypothetical protein HK100_005111 [Physocladia obscura]